MAGLIGEIALTGAERATRYRERHPERAAAGSREANRLKRLREPELVRARERAGYLRNCVAVRARQTAFRADRYAQLMALKSGACLDCGGSFHHSAMDFDHVPGRGEKAANVSRIIHRKPWTAVLAEIAKCDLICANCHRVRTYERIGR